MTIQQAKDELAKARKEARELKLKMANLREFLYSKGIDPDPEYSGRAFYSRNKKMYKAWKMGDPCNSIGRRFGISTGRVSSICRKIDFILERPNTQELFGVYKSLEKYRNAKG